MRIFDKIFDNLLGPPNVNALKVKKDVERLIRALQYKRDSFSLKNTQIRKDVARALGQIGDSRAIEPLICRSLDYILQ